MSIYLYIYIYIYIYTCKYVYNHGSAVLACISKYVVLWVVVWASALCLRLNWIVQQHWCMFAICWSSVLSITCQALVLDGFLFVLTIKIHDNRSICCFCFAHASVFMYTTFHFVCSGEGFFHHCVQANVFFIYFSLVLGVGALCVVLSVFDGFHGFCRCLCQDLWV